MNTINSLNETQAGMVAPKLTSPPSHNVSNFSQTLALAQTSKTMLTTAESSRINRPNLKQFMDRTGIEFLDASELIYGVIGSNTDVRDWSQIMASNDPVTAVRQATAEMYGRTNIENRTDATYMGPADTVAKEGNFAVRLLLDEDNKVVDQGLKLIDAQGLLLRGAGSTPETIARIAWLFGFDTKPLANLSKAAAIISADLGIAVQQASKITQAANMEKAVTQAPVLTMAADNVSLLTGLNVQTIAPVTAGPAFRAQTDDQATCPSLKQVLQDATANAFEYIDSASYLSSMFRA